MRTSVYQRRLIVTLILMGLFAPAVIWYGLAAMRNIRTSPTKWVPMTFQKRKEYDWFEKTFETNDSVIISWEGCTIDDPRLAELYETLHQPDDSPRGEQIRRYVDRVFTGRTLLDEMMDYPLELPEEMALARLDEALIGSDGKTTCCVILLADAGSDERKKSVPLMMEIAAEKAQIPEDDLHVVGPILDAYSIDVESVKSMRTFIVPSVLIVLILCRVCLKSWAYTILVFCIAIFGELTTLALVYAGNALFDLGPMNAVLIVMPPLVMVLTVSAAVHLVNYYHDEVRRKGPEGAPRKALRNGAMPCLLATSTTAIGLLSLVLSDIIPVKLFGLYATCGIVTTLVLLLFTLPGAQERWPVQAREKRENIFKDLSGVSNLVCRRPALIAALCLVVMIGAGWGLQHLRTSVSVRSLFAPGSRILRDYQWFEKNLGPITPVEVILHFDEDSGLDEVEQLEIVDMVHRRVDEFDEVHGTMSASTFFPSIPRSFGERRATAILLKRRVQKFDDINYTAIFDHYVILAPGESVEFTGIGEAEERLTLEGWFGPPEDVEEDVDWTVTTWTERSHFAVVFQGDDKSIFQDGKVAKDAANGNLPKIVRSASGEVTITNGSSQSPLAIDSLRFSDIARYHRDFSPPARIDRDYDTLALFQFAEVEADRVPDDSGKHFVALEPAQKSKRRLPDRAWRIGGRVAALGNMDEIEIDYGDFLAEIQRQIDPRLWAVHHMRDIRIAFQDSSRRDLADKRLLLIGAPAEAIDTGEDDANRTYASPEEKMASIFVAQLSNLLENRGFKRENLIAVNSASQASSEDIEEADGVILVRDVAGVSYDEVVQSAQITVDARQHSVVKDPTDPADVRIVTATYTGVMPLAYEVQNALLNDLIKSFLTAVVLVSVVMIVLQRSPVAGMVAMFPNVFPMVVLFGITSGLGMAVDIGTVMTASVALGIAVDDTLHFLTWYNREHSDTGDNIAGVKLAFRHCAKAMLQTTLICSMGLAIYSLSWFMPTRRFSWMMVSLLIAAVVGDLIFLPAILASPIGKLFPQRKLIGDPLAKKSEPSPSAPTESPATS